MMPVAQGAGEPAMSHNMTGQVQSTTTSHLERIINVYALLKRELADLIGL
jgi:hypothetical protein